MKSKQLSRWPPVLAVAIVLLWGSLWTFRSALGSTDIDAETNPSAASSGDIQFRPTTQQLADRATYIFIAEVTSTESFVIYAQTAEMAAGGLERTKSQLKVESSLKGDLKDGSSITIVQDGPGNIEDDSVYEMDAILIVGRRYFITANDPPPQDPTFNSGDLRPFPTTAGAITEITSEAQEAALVNEFRQLLILSASPDIVTSVEQPATLSTPIASAGSEATKPGSVALLIPFPRLPSHEQARNLHCLRGNAGIALL